AISHVNVLLNLTPIVGARVDGTTENNGWNGDMIVTLTHGGQTAVLLNRPGAGGGNPTGPRTPNGVAAGVDLPVAGGGPNNPAPEISTDVNFNYGYSDNGFGTGTLSFSNPGAFVFDDSASTDAHHYRSILTGNGTALPLGTPATGR